MNGPRPRFPRDRLGLAPWLTLFLSACSPTPSPVEPLLEPLTLEITGDGKSELTLTLPANQAVRITVDATTIDVRAELRDAADETLLDVDAPGRAAGTEVLLVESGPGRTVTLAVVGQDYQTSRGVVRIDAVALPTATEADRDRIASLRLESAAASRLDRSDPSRAQASARQFADAAAIYQRLNDQAAAARAKLHQASVHAWQLWDPAGSTEHGRKALRLARSAGNRETSAHALALIGAAQTGQADSMRRGDAAAAVAEFDRSRATLAEAAKLYHDLGLDSLEALSLNYRGVAAHYAGDWQAAEADYRRAGEIWRSLGDDARTSLPLQSLALLFHEQGEPRRAIEFFERALALKEGTRPVDYAHILNNSAMAHQVLGHFDEAIARYDEALRILSEAGDRPGEARALHGIGVALKAAGEPERAEAMLEQSLALRPAGSDDRSRIVALTALGELYRERGDIDRANDLHTEAIALATAPHEEARARVALARDYLATGALQDARHQLEVTLELALPEAHRYRARAWLELGEVEAKLGNSEASERAFANALRIHAQAGSDLEQAYALERRARVAFAAGDLGRVLDDSGSALELLHRLSLEGTHGDQRATFLASRRGTFELRVDALMQLAEAAVRNGDPGRAATLQRQALEVIEGGRSVALLDTLRQSGERNVPAGLLERRRELYELLVGKLARLDALQERVQPDADRMAAFTGEITRVRAELDAIEARIGLAGRRAATASPVSAATVLLEAPGTVAGEYFIGERNGWLFELEGESLAVHRLPPRSTLEPLARRLHEQWQAPAGDGGRSMADADELGALLFGPLRKIDPDAQLLVVPDGALYLLPLAVLAERPSSGLGKADVVVVPSLSALQSSGQDREPGSRLLAVVADPIFSTADPRVRSGVVPVRDDGIAATAGLTRAAPTLDVLARLPGAEVEARELLALVPERERLALLGSSATRERVLAAPLDQYRIVHFATHAWSNSSDPALATLALGLHDIDGRALDGILHLGDLSRLHLNAELVVLSGCETALGREIAGEGPVGLSHGFLRSGARAVIASLWRVPDSSTAVLMRRFYEQLLREQRPPAEALRRAQGAVRSQPRWSDPYYWAGFQMIVRSPQSRAVRTRDVQP